MKVGKYHAAGASSVKYLLAPTAAKAAAYVFPSGSLDNAISLFVLLFAIAA